MFQVSSSKNLHRNLLRRIVFLKYFIDSIFGVFHSILPVFQWECAKKYESRNS